MDVAVFVGFAASGPINIPVPVQSVAEYTRIFGDDAPLAWDLQRGEQGYAYLPPTVRAFFRNGGQRCWVVRVAGDAESNYFPVPGLAQIYEDGSVRPAFVRARSEGSWSDSLRVGTALLSSPVALQSFSLDPLVVGLTLNRPNDIALGDLLRLTFRDGQAKELYTVMFPVQAKDHGSLGGGVSGDPRSVQINGGQVVWFTPSWRMEPPSNAGLMRICTHDPNSPISSPISVEVEALEGVGSPPSLKLKWPTAAGDQTITLNVQAPITEAPEVGSLIRVDFDDEERELWLVVQAINISSEAGLSASKTVQIVGRGTWRLTTPPSPLPTARPTAEKLTFELWARQGETQSARMTNLTFAKSHARFWGSLPTDQQLYQSTDQEPYQDSTEDRRTTVPDLWKEVTAPRYPLAGPDNTTDDTKGFFFPLEMAALPVHFLGPERGEKTPLERDGLDRFTLDMFLDEALRDTSLEDFNSHADFLRYLNDKPRRLTGIHSVLSIPTLSSDEPTLIAVPDSVHRGWRKTEPSPSPPPIPSTPFFRPEWWHFSGCHPSPETIKPNIQSDKPQWEHFLNCEIQPVDRPLFEQESKPDQTGTFTLAWSSITKAMYILEEAVSPDFSDAVLVFTGKDEHLTLYGRRPGVYYYRARAIVGPNTSEWSVKEQPVRVGVADQWTMNAEEEKSETLLAVQRALLRMCAARGDLFAVLSLPKHYREDQAVAHVTTLKSPVKSSMKSPVDPADDVPPLGYREAGALSYGALYHPWLSGREKAEAGVILDIPPDGSICGVFAHRALTRGAWIAPANEVLQGVMALNHSISPNRWWRWQEAQINLIRQDPRGFLVLSSDTLSDDDDVRPINVRRLLMLLRRLALKLGATYVFEPHDDSFRRLVRRGFEAMLDQMFVRGAFAGKTPDTAYQVVVSDSLNTPQSVEQGRFIVEIRVAPSQPMAFLTIRLVQTGERGIVSEAG
jgi:hypothetical protein